MADELAEIDGHKPKVLLADGEDREVQSMSSNSTYKVKRTWDHYYCQCPAWRNQSGSPVNARTCKHLRDLLGEAYETARLKWKNPNGPPPKPLSKKKPASKSKPASKAKPASKGKRKRDDDDDEDDEDDEDVKPKKKPKKPVSKAKGKKKADSDEDDEEEEEDEKPKKKAKAAPKRKKKADSDDEDDDDDEDEDAKPKKKVKAVLKRKKKEDSDDEDDEEEEEKPKKKAKAVHKRKKNADSEDEEEEADEEDEKPKKKAKAVLKRKKKADSDDEDDEEEEEKPKKKAKAVPKRKKKADSDDEDEDDEDEKPKRKPSSKNKPKSKRPKVEEDDDDDEDEKPKKKPASKAKKAKADDDDDEDDDDNSGGKKLPAVLLANKWDLDKGPDPTGWWISEKLDGVRTFYDGKGMVSRLGNPFTPPKWFLDKLPKDVTLDGELFAGRGQFQDTVSIVKTVNSPHWKEITFQIFDIPSENTVFEDRIATLVKLFGPGGKYECPEVVLVEHEKAKNRQHVLDKLKEIEGLGGEGLMLRRAGSKYEGRRSGTLLKIKTFYDAEAQVTGYTDGKGKNVGVIGALKCKMESGKTFNVGTGLSDKQRKSPPKVGSIIVYRFQELTRDGVPRFPSFIGEAIDKKKAKDAVIPPHRKTGASKD